LDVHVKAVQEELAALAVVETEKGKKKAPRSRTAKATATTDALQEGTSKKRKIKESHGVEVLKKVNVEGMQKISSFFQKKGPKS
jgi:ribonuclease H2 subunit B